MRMETSNVRKNKETTECDKSTVICDVGIAQCDNGTVKCKKKIREPLNMTKVLFNVMLQLQNVRMK